VREPATDDIAVNAEQGCRLGAQAGLPTGKQQEDMQSLALGRMPFAREQLFAVVS
jgi:hypothetical protein